ncbi:MAG TPA: glutamyl-tRNA reductase [bacterium]|nr:glutamyl-tRNA reductase [bacterium]
MAIELFAVDYRELPASIRDRVALAEARAPHALHQLASRSLLDEVVLLVTCHRCEIYAVTCEPDRAAALAQTVLSQSDPPVRWRHASGADAARHLCRVACGLDSSALGEAQVLGQVREALAKASAAGTAGTLLNRLFHIAISAGRRARQAGLGGRGASLADAAVHLAAGYFGGLGDRRALVIGTGVVAGLVARALEAMGVRELAIAGRRLDRAAALSGSAILVPLGRLGEVLAEVDVAVSATSAPSLVLEAATVRHAMAARPRPLVLVDLAVPRDIDPAARGIEGVTLFDADDVAAHAGEIIHATAEVVQRAEAIAAAAAASFDYWLQSRQVVPSVVRLREQADRIQQAELTKTLRRIPSLTEHERAVVTGMAARIVNRLLHAPTVRLKAEAAAGNGDHLRQALVTLFGLEQDDS